MEGEQILNNLILNPRFPVWIHYKALEQFGIKIISMWNHFIGCQLI